MSRDTTLISRSLLESAWPDTLDFVAATPGSAGQQLPAAVVHPRPGSGKTLGITLLTIVTLIVAWWWVTAQGWIKPLFLPSPSAVWNAGVQAWNGNVQGGLPLLQHLGWSLLRVFGAFLLAALTAVPVGLLMGDQPHCARHLRSVARVLPAIAAAGLFAADRDLVRHR